MVPKKEEEEEEEESEEEDAAEPNATTDDDSAESYTDRASTRGGEPSRSEEEEDEEEENSGDDEVVYQGTTVSLPDRDEAPTKKASKASTKSYKSILMRNRFASSRPARNDFNTKVSQERLASEVNDKMEHRGGWHFESKGTGDARRGQRVLPPASSNPAREGSQKQRRDIGEGEEEAREERAKGQERPQEGEEVQEEARQEGEEGQEQAES